MEDSEAQRQKHIYMTTKPVSRLICRMAAPAMVSMLTTALYNMADTFFVSRISTQATAAVGIVFSYMSLIQALAFFFGMGSATYIARALGARDTKNAAAMAATGFFSALIAGACIGTAGLMFRDEILEFLGSTPTIMPQARDYFRWILVGTPFIMSSFVMNNQMRFQGNAAMAMVGIASGAVLNIVLDPLLIFVLGMGTEGASIATMLSQCVGFFILFRMTSKRDGIAIRLKNFSPTLAHYREIVAGGTPSLGRQGLASVGIACLNRAAGVYGDAAVAAFSVVNRCFMLATSLVIGFGQGFQPMCGFNFGAGKFDRVRAGFIFSVSVTTCYCVLMAAAGMIFPRDIIAFFRPEDADLIAVGSVALTRQAMAYPLVGFIMMSNMYLQVTRRTVRASLLAASRQGMAFLPILYIGRHFFGIEGLMSAQALADAATFLLAAMFVYPALNNMDRDRRAMMANSAMMRDSVTADDDM